MGVPSAAAESSARGSAWRPVAAALGTLLVCLTLASASVLRPTALPDPQAARIQRLAGIPPPPQTRSWAPRPLATGGLRALAIAGPSGFDLYTAGGAVSFLPGINLGATTPGHEPGALAVAAEDYKAWFAAMGWLGIRAVRVYTIHPPAFYTELAAYNRVHPDRPLYLVQGVYLPDESYVDRGNLYDRAVTAAFSAELRDASAAVSGALTRPRIRGRASGTWTTDVRDWLAAWIIGVEWDPHATGATDRANAGAPLVLGRYFRSAPQATPTERWLTARMDELATAEAARGRTMPIAFANWPTTDPLRHPYEPQESEDLVGVDANHVRPTSAWPGGTFASYHAYPYYPDFQRHEPALQSFEYAGRADPYAGYLSQLRQHHRDMPVMVTEFGVPSSLGSAHHGPLGRSQGGHSEREAMQIDADLLRLIHDLGLAGGFLFAWTDEWFKFSWNTIAHQIPPDRRALWHDPLTNEQHFGLLATDAQGSPSLTPGTMLDNPAAAPARSVRARVDEAYVQLAIRLAEPVPERLTIGLDVLPDATGTPPPGASDPRPETAFELALAARTGQAWVRTELDPVQLDYDIRPAARPAPSNGWQRFQLIVNRDLIVPPTKQQLPIEMFDAGILRHGTWDPADPAADSRALWHLAGSELTVRIPWAMAGFADPSSHRVLVPRGKASKVAASPGIGVVLSAGGVDQYAGLLRWPGWDETHHTERLKSGARAVRDAMVETATTAG